MKKLAIAILLSASACATGNMPREAAWKDKAINCAAGAAIFGVPWAVGGLAAFAAVPAFGIIGCRAAIAAGEGS